MTQKKYLALSLTLFMTACTGIPSTDTRLIQIPNGVLIGDVNTHSAVIWSRADQKAIMVVELSNNESPKVCQQLMVTKDTDYAGNIHIDTLKPNTQYHYQVGFIKPNTEPANLCTDNQQQSTIARGHFQTAPAENDAKPVQFIWGGDVGGQNTCRDKEQGYPIFNTMNKTQWDFFIGLGDMIYGDGLCEAVGRFGNRQIVGDFTVASDLKNYWAHWFYNRVDPAFQQFVQNMPYIAVWDDHEIMNDAGPLHDTRKTEPNQHLLPIALKAFLDYNPISTTKQLYRTIAWGKHLELFVLDTRQYRDANTQADNALKPKTMLGKEQLAWLKQHIQNSKATWKVIISSVPMSIPTGGFGDSKGRDGWANDDQDTGFEYELIGLLRFMQQQGIKNTLWLTTDVHFSTGFCYQPFKDAPDFNVYEFASGPLSSGFFPNEKFDQTLHPQKLFFYGNANIADYAQALNYFNFGTVAVDSHGDLTVSIVNANGHTVAKQFIKAR